MELMLALVLTCIIEAAVTFVIIWIFRNRRIGGRTANGHQLTENGQQQNGSEQLRTGNRQQQTENRTVDERQPELRPKYIMIYYNLLCNLLTNPLLNLGLYGAFCLGAGRELITILTITGEICVVAAEYGLYRLMSHETRKLCFILALVTNVISYLSGFILM